MNPNFNSGFLQEAFRLSDENWNKYGDPNLYYNQQIRQNQATLGQIQNIGALQQNQIQQLQALKQMQDIQKAAEEERINQILYPVNDGRGGSFFANLRQMEAMKTADALTQQQLATEDLINQRQSKFLKAAEQADQFLAARAGEPKIRDFKDRVSSLLGRITTGGQDGVLALKELETMVPSKDLSEYTGQGGVLRDSPELRAAADKILTDARASARVSQVSKIRDSALKTLTETQLAADELMEMKGYMSAEEFEQAASFRARVQDFTLKADYANPDPVAISNLSMEAGKFNLGKLKRLREAREGAQVVQEANPNLNVTEVKSGPQGVEVKSEKERPVAASSEQVKSRQEEIAKKREEISQNEADIEMLRERARAGKTGSELQLKNKDGTSSGIGVDDLIARNKVLERQLKELQDIYGTPRTGKEQQVSEELSGKGELPAFRMFCKDHRPHLHPEAEHKYRRLPQTLQRHIAQP